MKFLLATKNKHKIAEFSRILTPLGISVLSEADLDRSIDEVEENGKTFEENAFIKATAVSRITGLPAIADDSGLCVDFLNGEPGIYSARFAGEPIDNDKNNEKLLRLLSGVEDEKRTAKFVCCIACVFPDGRKFSVHGECAGRIAKTKIGTNGFGYDPLFISEIGSFGTLSDSEKDSVSHRGRALAKFAEIIGDYMKEV